MVKRILLAFALALWIPAASFAAISLYASTWDTNDLGNGNGFGARLGISLAPRLQLELGAAYYEEFDGEVNVERLAFGPILTVQVVPLDLGLRFDLGRRGGFYLGGGGTYYLLDSDNGDADDEAGYYALLGYQLTRTFFLEGVYRQVEGTVQPPLENGGLGLLSRFDVDLGGIAINLGIRF